MSSELILVVCAANVCRSPLGELLLRSELQALGGVRVESAGTRVRGEVPICDEVAAHRSGTDWQAGVRDHCARPVTAQLLASAALVLAADSEVRADVVTLNPVMRKRTFTLREAAHLGAEFAPVHSGRRYGVVSGYALHLDRSRSVIGPVPAGKPQWWRRRTVDPASIVDRHGQPRFAHFKALREVEQAAMVVAGQLATGGRQ